MMNKINPKDMKDFDNPYKIALVAMQDDEGDMHTCLLSTLMNKGDDKMMFGQFVRGKSEAYIYRHPKTGFLIMSMDKDFWTGSMDFTHSVTEGEDYVKMNEYPLFRFNTYFGVSDVHYANLVEISQRQKLNMPGVVANAVKTFSLKGLYAGDREKKVLRPWAEAFLKKMDTLKFISYMGENGYPKVVPVIQAQAASSSRIVFPLRPYEDLLSDLKEGARVNIYGMSLSMEVVLVKGCYHVGGMGLSYVDIDKVYNCAPPKAGYIYPELRNDATDFSKEPLSERRI